MVGIGGRHDPDRGSFVGGQSVDQINSMRADAVFMSVSAVDATDAFHREEHITTMKRAMVHSATKRYLLVDHSKLGRVALHRVASLLEFDMIITDKNADSAVLTAWTTSGVKFEVA